MSDKPKVIIGTIEIVNFIAVYARAFAELGYETRTIALFKNWAFPDEEYDALCCPTSPFKEKNSFKRYMGFIKSFGFGLNEFIKSMGRDNWFIFIYGSSFLPFHYYLPILNFVDYAILKQMNNVLVSVFCGCDINSWQSYIPAAEKYGLPNLCQDCMHGTPVCDYHRSLRNIKAAEKYSDVIITMPYMAFLLNKPYYYLWQPVEVKRYDYKIPRNPVPKIVHAPSDRAIKGTRYILSALERLKFEGFNFELILIENMPNLEVKRILVESDIAIDQLFSTTTGVFALEALASGCAVLGGINKQFQGLPEDCPVIPTGSENVYNNLRTLLEDKNRIYELAEQGRRFVETYHDSVKVVSRMINWIENHPRDELIIPKK